ncbi:hypothetical protein JXB31_02975 [Candidatus Woesearchaeota archaeon]|nr:hypothetical protein [Candidatus Woesearchaeota archaeon]
MKDEQIEEKDNEVLKDLKAASERIEEEIANDNDDPALEKKSNELFWYSLLIIAIIAAGIILIPKMFHEEQELIEDSYSYNHFKFEKRYGTWFTESQEISADGRNLLFEIALVYGPRELEDVKVTGDIYNFSRYHTVYITFDPTKEAFGNLTLANAEVTTKLAAHFGVTLITACTKNTTECIEFGAEIISCEDKNSTKNGIIFFDQEPGPEIVVDNNCAIIRGENSDIIKAADRFMLGYYGIMG